MNTPTRPADPGELTVDIPNIRAPKMPTFAEPIACEDCGHTHDLDDGCPELELDGADYEHVSGWGFFPRAQ